ncbi:hypothetical protein LOTGIDRAFT_110884 [Lottia gigantea]|uniref:WxxW domain-containing protein n=1 Tax=Lottia gigantea TaxID=225164 RepID=V4BA54_LOTGI|nr:hypothetical protein LOTGIDRAFT_110884 [Lottia gigantea]ESP02752.1 hypothetical protein LOTGIDRAFT_110884 [Lottia gigantea]
MNSIKLLVILKFVLLSLLAKPQCTWTRFYDRDNPSASGDWEDLSTLRKENKGEICEKPVDIEARLTDGRPYTAGGDIITLSASVGLICKNNQQTSGNRCDDYKVRFCCPKG